MSEPTVARILNDAVRRSKTALPHMSELAEHFVAASGGPKKLAGMLMKEWEKAPEGSAVRTQIFSMIQKVWKYGSDSRGDETNPDSLTDEELEEEINTIVSKMVAGVGSDGEKTGQTSRLDELQASGPAIGIPPAGQDRPETQVSPQAEEAKGRPSAEPATATEEGGSQATTGAG